ncbi:PilZ domain-containing protein [Azospira inquinata]|uniref:Cyclic diguanosine monophosphate-binding protein n=1 Tax=Azospira inquinata TaxID=2785627 RepID=A0A975XTK8_9RHOO|nr:PilZ domain-containing protein [Azospira inquinata]QWT46839.1 PilZ domain-containing protein [Azospira inquinata]QWT47839.1 PilZ domain-containing protein [Azospira inquinata]
MTQADRRHFTRVLFQTPARLILADGTTLQGEIRDLSLKGALLSPQTPWQGDSGQSCRLEIDLGEGQTRVTMSGHLAHVSPTQIGLRCEDIDLDSISHLRRLVELNLGDDALLNRDLAALVAGATQSPA